MSQPAVKSFPAYDPQILLPETNRRLRRLLDATGSIALSGNDPAVRDLKAILRQTTILELLYDRHIIAVTGVQGAGKSTLIGAMYGLLTEKAETPWIIDPLGRGERLPIVFAETEGVEQPAAYVYTYQGRAGGTEDITKKPISAAEYQQIAREPDQNTGSDLVHILLEVQVPPRFFPGGQGGFLLLPGFEGHHHSYARETGDNRLIYFALIAASQYLLVVNNQAAYQELEMHQAFQQWFRESKPLFVLPRNEENPGGGQRIKTALAEKLGLSATEYDRIVCTGIEHPAYPTAVWIAQLQQAIAKYGARDRSVLATQLAQLTQLFDQRLVNILNQIGLAADRKSDLRAPLDYAFKDYLQEYKQAAAEQDEYLLRELGKIVGEEVEVFFENIEQGLGQQKGLKKYWDGFVRMVLHEGRLTEKEIRHLETELREAWNARLETLVPRWATSWEAEAVWLKTLPAGDFSPVRLQPGEAYEPDVDLSELLEKLPRLTKYGLLHKNERISVLQARLPQVLPTTGLPTLSNGSLLNTVADSVGSFIPSGKWAKVFISLFRQVNGVAQQAEKYSKRALATALVHRLADDTLRAYHASYGELSAQLQNRVRRYLEQYLNIKRERAEYENLQVLISQLHGTIGELKKLANRQHAYFYDTKD